MPDTFDFQLPGTVSLSHALDAHTLGITSAAELLKECGYGSHYS
jgi:hypothetical protein